jgi:biotin carboxyl carrier protein
MEMPVESPVAGTVREVLVSPEQSVAEGDALVTLD